MRDERREFLSERAAMTFEQWEAQVPDAIRADVVWKLEAYRKGLFLGDLAWTDATRLLRDRRSTATADQLYRAASNVSSNVCEGYSRSTGKDRARFFEYALGSAREARDWYYKSRRVLRQQVVLHRIELTTPLVGLLIAMIKTERRRTRITVQVPKES